VKDKLSAGLKGLSMLRWNCLDLLG